MVQGAGPHVGKLEKTGNTIEIQRHSVANPQTERVKTVHNSGLKLSRKKFLMAGPAP